MLLIPGWIPATTPVYPPEIEVKENGVDKQIPATAGKANEEESETIVDPDWMIDYRRHALEAFIAGALMTIVSRLSHILAKPGTLRHEAYMSMYAYLVSALIVPAFML